ncbi:hypothetical protein [Caballeronia sp. J97]|uniref:hypothetical protein n=1 Tax=Caballeronia sp. J97 TaxID=2805429 RepID=UPI002AB2156E|nr:hypothetical protein [Caballeronia sp. J97]
MWYWESCVAKRVDLKNDELSSKLKLKEIARRARVMLHRRSSEAIEAVAAKVDVVIEQYFDDAGYPCDDGDCASPGSRHGVIADAAALADVIRSYDLKRDADFPNGEAYEYFAVLALCHAVQADHILSLAHEKATAGTLTDDVTCARQTTGVMATDWIDDPFTWWQEAGYHALEAMEASCWAERFAHERTLRAVDDLNRQIAVEVAQTQDLEAATKKTISETASRNAGRRHAGTNAAKRRAHELFKRHRSACGSLEALAEAITEMIEVEARGPDVALRPVAQRTVRRWLTDFGKNGRPPHKQ